MRVLAVVGCIVVASALCGCLPPYASVVVRDTPEPTADFVWHDGDLYTRREVYSLQSLAERLALPAISHVKIYRTDDRAVEVRAVELCGLDGNQPTLRLDETTIMPVSEVDRIELFREIPKSQRRQGFLVSVVSVTLLFVAGQGIDPDPWDWNKIAIGTAAGAALGTVSLLRHEELSERVLFVYETNR